MSKQKEIVLMPQHTGLNNYSDPCNCPIAMAMKDAGFKGVMVAPNYISYKKWFLFFPYTKHSPLPSAINRLAHKWSAEKQN